MEGDVQKGGTVSVDANRDGDAADIHLSNTTAGCVKTPSDTTSANRSAAMLMVKQLSKEEKNEVDAQQMKFTHKQIVVYENIIAEREEDFKSLKIKYDHLKMQKEEDTASLLRKDCEISSLEEKIESLMKKPKESLLEDSSIDSLMAEVQAEREENGHLSSKLEDQITITSKTEETLNTMKDLVSTKNLLIKSLQEQLNRSATTVSTANVEIETETNAILDNGKDEPIPNSVDMISRQKFVELTNNFEGKISLLELEIEELKSKLESAATPQELPSPKNGVKESYEYIELHATNGVVMDPFLLWADIQRKMHPENTWKSEAEKRFVKKEITEAKETLWKVAGEEYIGKMIKRQGSGKSTAEVNDICVALKKLSEKQSIPLFLCTSSMVAKTPIYAADCTVCDASSLNKHLEKLDETVGNMVDAIKEMKVNNLQQNNSQGGGMNSSKEQKKIETAFGGTIPFGDTMRRRSQRRRRLPNNDEQKI